MPRSYRSVVLHALTVSVALLCAALAPAPGQEPAPAPGQEPAPAQAPKPAAGAKAQAAAPEALPTTDEMHQLFNEGKYKETLQKLSRVLALKGGAGKAYDRHDLLVLKAETHLRQKESSAASTAFELAAKEAPDEKAKATDVASAMLVKRSRNLTFTPTAKKASAGGAGGPGGAGAVAAGAGAKAGVEGGAKAGAAPSGPIDITDPEKRKEAFAAMFAEQKQQVAPKLKAGTAAKSLPPLVEALQATGPLRTLELAATGEDAEAKAMVQDLSQRAQKMMGDALKQMTTAVTEIEAAANDYRPVATAVRNPLGGAGVMMERGYRKRGLMTPDVQELKRIVSDCQRLVPATNELADALGASGEEFKQIGKDAAALHDKAKTVLTHDYANEYTRAPRPERNVRPRQPQ